MRKSVKLGGIIFIPVIFTFALSFSVLQACVVLPGKSCSSEPCDDETCSLIGNKRDADKSVFY